MRAVEIVGMTGTRPGKDLQVSTPPSGEPPYPGAQPNQQGYPQAGGGHPDYPQGPYGGPPARPSNGLGIASLVLGILAILTFWTVFGGVILGLIAVILGIIALRQVSKGIANNKGVSIAGVVTGAIGVIAVVVTFAVGASLFFSSGGGNFVDCLKQAGQDQAQAQQCAQQYRQNVYDQTGR